MAEKSNVLVLYFSLTGKTELIARSVAEAAGADIEMINLEKNPFNRGIISLIRSWIHTVTRPAPPVAITVNPEQYETIFIGTPVWGSTYASPIRSFLREYHFKNKKIGLFCVYNSKDGNVIENLKEGLAGNHFIGSIGFSRPEKHPRKLIQGKVQEWVKKVMQKGVPGKK